MINGRSSSLNKAASLVLVLLFTVNTLAYSAPQIDLSAPASSREASYPPFEIKLPSELGTVQGIYEGRENEPLIIHIQDAHGSYDAQKKIRALIEYLNKEYGVNLLLLEGGRGKLNPGIFEFSGEKDVGLGAADLLMQRGEFSGAEAFLLDAEGKAEAYGLEDAAVYREDLELFRAVWSRSRETCSFAGDLETKARALEAKHFSALLKGVVNDWRDFGKDRASLLRYAEQLRRYALEHLKLDLKGAGAQKTFPSILRMLRLKDLEGSFDLRKAEEEKAAFAGALRGLGADEALLERLAKIGDEALPRLLFEKIFEAHDGEFDIAAYPQFSLYARYLIYRSEIEAPALFRELSALSDELFSALAKTENEKKTLGVVRDIAVLRKILRLELSREEYQAVTARGAELAPSAILGRLEEIREGPAPAPVDPGAAEQAFREALRFYEIAEARENSFFENAREIMKRTNSKHAVVVSGGFHSRGLREKFSADGISYVEISPRMDWESESSEIYLTAMLGGDAGRSQISNILHLIDLDTQEAMGAFLKERAAAILNAVVEAALSRGKKKEEILREIASGEFARESRLSFETREGRVSVRFAGARDPVIEFSLQISPESRSGKPALTSLPSAASLGDAAEMPFVEACLTEDFRLRIHECASEALLEIPALAQKPFVAPEKPWIPGERSDEARLQIDRIAENLGHLEKFREAHNEVLKRLTTTMKWSLEDAEHLMRRFRVLVQSFAAFSEIEEENRAGAVAKLTYLTDLYGTARDSGEAAVNGFFRQMEGLWHAGEERSLANANTLNRLINWMHGVIEENILKVDIPGDEKQKTMANEIVDIQHVRAGVPSPAAGLLAATESVWSGRTLINGNDFWVRAHMGVHHMQAYAHLVPPELGGNIEFIHFEGGAKTGNLLRLSLISRVFEKMGFSVAVSKWDGYLRASLSQKEGAAAATLEDLHRRMVAGLRILSRVKELDVRLRDLEEAYNPQGKSPSPMDNLLEAWADEIVRSGGSFSPRDIPAEYTEPTAGVDDSEAVPMMILLDPPRGKPVEAEGKTVHVWTGKDPYVDKHILAFREYAPQIHTVLNRELGRLGLPLMPDYNEAVFGQFFIDQYFNRPVEEALAEKKVLRAGGFARNLAYLPEPDPVVLLKEWMKDDVRPDGVKTAKLIEGLPLKYRYAGRIGEARLYKADLNLLSGRQTVYSACDPRTGKSLFALVLREKAPLSFGSVGRELAANHLVSAEAFSEMEEPAEDAVNAVDFVLRAPPRTSIYVGEVAQGVPLMQGIATGKVLFDGKAPKEEMMGSVLFAEGLTDSNVSSLWTVNGMGTKTGNVLDHLNMRAKKYGKPRVTLPELEFGEAPDGGRVMRIPILPREEKQFSEGYHLSWPPAAAGEEEWRTIREGDIVTVNGTSGEVYFLNGIPDIREAFSIVREIEEAPDEALKAATEKLFRFIERMRDQGDEDALTVLKFLLTRILLYGSIKSSGTQAFIASRLVGFLGRSGRGGLWGLIFGGKTKFQEEIENHLKAIFLHAKEDFLSVAEDAGEALENSTRIDQVYFEAAKIQKEGMTFAAIQLLLRPLLGTDDLVDLETVRAGVEKSAKRKMAALRDQTLVEITRFLEEAEQEFFAGDLLFLVHRLSEKAKEFRRLGMELPPGPVKEIQRYLEKFETEQSGGIARAVSGTVLTLNLKDVNAAYWGLVGNKAANLGWLEEFLKWYELKNGEKFHISEGDAITVFAYRLFLDQPASGGMTLRDSIREILDSTDTNAEKADRIKTLILSTPLPGALEKLIREKYDKGIWADRSSTTIEDTPRMSAAGIFKSVLGANSPEQVIDSLKETWASFFSETALNYREEAGISPLADELQGAIIQVLVDADASGVITSADMKRMDRGSVTINAGYGLGTSIVGDENVKLQDADVIVIDKVTGHSEKYAGKKEWKVIVEESGFTKSVPTTQDERETEDGQRKLSVSDEAIERLTRLAVALEDWFGFVVDVEFAVKGPEIYILQIRAVPGFRVPEEEKEAIDQWLHLAEAASLGSDQGTEKVEAMLAGGIGLNIHRAAEGKLSEIPRLMCRPSVSNLSQYPPRYPENVKMEVDAISANADLLDRFRNAHNEVLSLLSMTDQWDEIAGDHFLERFENLTQAFIQLGTVDDFVVLLEGESQSSPEPGEKFLQEVRKKSEEFRTLYEKSKAGGKPAINSFFARMLGLWDRGNHVLEEADTFNKFINWMHSTVGKKFLRIGSLSPEFYLGNYSFLDIQHYRSGIPSLAGRVLSGVPVPFDSEVLLNGTSLWIQNQRGTHPIQAYGNLIPPELGGCLEFTYFETDFRTGNLYRMELVTKVFRKLGFTVDTFPGRRQLTASFGLKQGAASVEELAGKMEVALQLLYRNFDLDYRLSDLALGYQQEREGKDPDDFIMQQLLETWSDEVIQSGGGFSPMSVSTVFLEERTGQSERDPTPAMIRSDPEWPETVTRTTNDSAAKIFVWDTSRAYTDFWLKTFREFAPQIHSALNKTLEELGLSAMPRYDESEFGQLFIDRYFNEPVEKAVEEGGLAFFGENLKKTDSVPRADAEIFAEAWSRPEDRQALIETARFIDKVPFSYEYAGRIGGAVLLKADLSFLSGRYTVLAVENAKDKTLMAATILERGRRMGLEEIRTIFRDNNAALGRIPVQADSLLSEIIADYDGILKTPPGAAVYVGDVLRGVPLLHGVATGEITFQERAPKENLEEKILVANNLTDRNLPALKWLNGMITECGNSLDHVNMRAKSRGKPRVLLPEMRRGEDGEGPFIRVPLAAEESVRIYQDYPLTVPVAGTKGEQWVMVREGDIVTIDGTKGEIYYFGNDRNIREAFSILKKLENPRGAEDVRSATRELSAFVVSLLGQGGEKSLRTVKFILGKILLHGSLKSPVEERRVALDQIRKGSGGWFDFAWSILSGKNRFREEIEQHIRALFLRTKEDFLSSVESGRERIRNAARIDQIYYETALIREAETNFSETQEILRDVISGPERADLKDERAKLVKTVKKRLYNLRDELSEEAVRMGTRLKHLGPESFTVNELFILRRFFQRVGEFERLKRPVNVPELESLRTLTQALEREKALEREAAGKVIEEGSADGLALDLGGIDDDYRRWVGNKAGNLGWLEDFLKWHEKRTGEKFYVAPGAGITTGAYLHFIEQPVPGGLTLREAVQKILDSPAANGEKSEKVRALFLATPLPEALEALIREKFAEGYWAGRSSTTIEDSPTMSAAGIFKSVLGAHTPEEMIQSLKEIWASLFSEDALDYREENGLLVYAGEPQGAVIQALVNADASGVVTSVDMTRMDRGTVMINAGYGLGTSIVGDESVELQDADLILVDKLTGHAEKIAGEKQRKVVVNKNGFTKEVPTTEEERKAEDGRLKISVSDEVIDRLARLAVALEEWFGYVVDLEFAVEGNKIYILQVRPVPGFEVTVEQRQQLDGWLGLSAAAASLGMDRRTFVKTCMAGLGALAAGAGRSSGEEEEAETYISPSGTVGYRVTRHGDFGEITARTITADLGSGRVEIVPYSHTNKDHEPAVGTIEDIAADFQEETGLVVEGAGNGSFFDVSTGVPIGFLLRNGEFEFFNLPEPARSMVAFTQPAPGKPAQMLFSDPGERPKFWLTVQKKAADGSEGRESGPMKIHGVNVPRGNNGFVVYTPTYGASTRTNDWGTEIIVERKSRRRLDGSEAEWHEVTEVRENAGDSRIPPGGFVISLHGYSVNTYRNAFPVGARIDRHFSLPAGWEEKGVTHGLMTGPHLIRNGAIHVTAREEKFTVPSNDRMILAKTPEGKAKLIWLHSGRGSISFHQTAAILEGMGIADAVNLDGGSSRATYAQVREGEHFRLLHDAGRGVPNAVLFAVHPRSVVMPEIEAREPPRTLVTERTVFLAKRPAADPGLRDLGLFDLACGALLVLGVKIIQRRMENASEGRAAAPEEPVSGRSLGGKGLNGQRRMDREDRYARAFELFVRSTNEKQVLTAMIGKILWRSFPLEALEQEGSFLDVGAGSGDLAEPLLRYFSNGVAVEINAAEIRKLAARGLPNLEVLNGSLQEYEPRQNFDMILASHMLYYLEPEERLVQTERVLSWLKEPGKLVIILNSAGRSPGSISHFLATMKAKDKEADPEEIAAALRAKGWRVDTEKAISRVEEADADAMYEILNFFLRDSIDGADALAPEIRHYMEEYLRDDERGVYRLFIPQEILVVHSGTGASLGEQGEILDLQAIEVALREVQENIENIRKELKKRHGTGIGEFSDDAIRYAMEAYRYLDEILAEGKPLELRELTALNHKVQGMRNGPPAQDGESWVWFEKHRNLAPFSLAAGVYMRAVSPPQLFDEGNSHTGTLWVNYILANAGLPPLVLTAENAVEYLALAGKVRSADRTTIGGFIQAYRYERRFREFLEREIRKEASWRFLRPKINPAPARVPAEKTFSKGGVTNREWYRALKRSGGNSNPLESEELFDLCREFSALAYGENVPALTERSVLLARRALNMHYYNEQIYLLNRLRALGKGDRHGLRRWFRDVAWESGRIALKSSQGAVDPYEFVLDLEASKLVSPGQADILREALEEEKASVLERFFKGQAVLAYGLEVRFDPVGWRFVIDESRTLGKFREEPLVVRPPPKVVISILVYNGWEDTEKLLESLRKIETPNVEVVVLDNGSTEDRLDSLARFSNSPAFRLSLLRSPRNLGFDEGHNAVLDYALDEAHADYFMALNNDVIVDRDFLDKLLPVFENGTDRMADRVGVAGPLVLDKDGDRLTGVVQSFGAVFPKRALLSAGNIWKGKTAEDVPHLSETDVVIGPAPVFSAEALRLTGGYDPRYFAYGEELDMGLRFAELGFKSFVSGDSRIWHIGKGPSSGGYGSAFRTRHNIQNNLLNILKHPGLRDIRSLFKVFLSSLNHSQRSLRRFFRTRELACLLAPEQGVADALFGKFSDVQVGELDWRMRRDVPKADTGAEEALAVEEPKPVPAGEALFGGGATGALISQIVDEFDLGEVLKVEMMPGGGSLQSKPIPRIKTVKGDFAIKQLKNTVRTENDALFILHNVLRLRNSRAGLGNVILNVCKGGTAGEKPEDLFTVFRNPETGNAEYYSVEKWGQARTIEREEAGLPTLREVGRKLGEVHKALRNSENPYELSPGCHKFSEAIAKVAEENADWYKKLCGYLAPDEKALIDTSVKEIRDYWQAHPLEELPAPQAIPSDMNFANMLFDDAGEKIAAIFDWDQMRIGYRAEDFFSTLIQTGRPGKFYVGDLRKDLGELLEGWGETVDFPLTPEEEESLPAIFVSKSMFYIAMMSERLSGEPANDVELMKRIRGQRLQALEMIRKVFPPVADDAAIMKKLLAEIVGFDARVQGVEVELVEGSPEPGRPAYWDGRVASALPAVLAAQNAAVLAVQPHVGSLKDPAGKKEKKKELDEAGSRAFEEIMLKSRVPVWPVSVEGPGEGVPTLDGRKIYGARDGGEAVHLANDVACGTSDAVEGDRGNLAVSVIGAGIKAVPDRRGISLFVRKEVNAEVRFGDLAEGETPEGQMMENFRKVAAELGKDLRDLRVALWAGSNCHERLMSLMEAAGMKLMKLPGSVESYATFDMLDRNDPDAPDVVIGLGLPESEAGCAAMCVLRGGKGWIRPITSTAKRTRTDLSGIFDYTPADRQVCRYYGLDLDKTYRHDELFLSPEVFSIETGVTGVDKIPAVQTAGGIVTTVTRVVDPSGAVWKVTLRSEKKDVSASSLGGKEELSAEEAEALRFLEEQGVNFDPRFNYRTQQLKRRPVAEWTGEDWSEYRLLADDSKKAYDWMLGWFRKSPFYEDLKGHPPVLLSMEGVISAVEQGVGPRLTSFHGGLGVLFGEWIRAIAYLGGVTTLDGKSEAPEFLIFIPDYEMGVTISQIDAFGYPAIGAREISRPKDHGIEFFKDPADPAQPFEVSVPIYEGAPPVLVRFSLVKVGAIRIIMPTTDFEKNDYRVRKIFEELYKGHVSSRDRFEQEWIAGIAAYEFRRKLGIPNGPVHLNETATFPYLIGLIRDYMEQGYSYDEAMELVGGQIVFFTHTLVPAGIDRFNEQTFRLGDNIRFYFENSGKEDVRKQAGDVARWMIHGKETEIDGQKIYLPGFEKRDQRYLYLPLNFVVRLAYIFKGSVAAVSQLNAIKAGEFFIQEGILSPEEVRERPVTGITNAVDHLFWMIPEFKKAMHWEKADPEERTPEAILDPEDLQALALVRILNPGEGAKKLLRKGAASRLDDESMERILAEYKRKAVGMVRRTVKGQYIRETAKLEARVRDGQATAEESARLHVMRVRWAGWNGIEASENWVQSWEGLPDAGQEAFREKLQEGGLEGLLDPDDFLADWSRRIVGYKRILFTMLGKSLPEIESLMSGNRAWSPWEIDAIISDLDRKGAFDPFIDLVVNKRMQFIFAGKSFSEDGRGSIAMIQRAVEYLSCRHPEIQNRVVFLEGYDETRSQYLVRGVDEWLNTPKRPLEASGTSGMKMSGGRNLFASPKGDGWGASGIFDRVNGRIQPVSGKNQNHPDEWPPEERTPEKVAAYLEQEAENYYRMLAEEAWIYKEDRKEWLRAVRRWVYYTAIVYDIRREFTGGIVPSFDDEIPGGPEIGITDLYVKAIKQTAETRARIDERRKAAQGKSLGQAEQTFSAKEIVTRTGKYFKELNQNPESPVFREETLKAAPVSRDEREVILEIVGALASEIEAKGGDRHLLTILEAARERLPDSAAEKSISELLEIFGRQGDVLPRKDEILRNPAYQAVTWYFRALPKRDLHAHVSDSASPEWIAASITERKGERYEKMMRVFRQKKEKHEENYFKNAISRDKFTNDAVYQIVSYFIAQAERGRWPETKEAARVLRGIFSNPETKGKDFAWDVSITDDGAFIESMRHSVRQYFQDGVEQVELRFNPFKSFMVDGNGYRHFERIGPLLGGLDAMLREEEAAADRLFGGTHQVRFSFCFSREKKDIREVRGSINRLIKLRRAAEKAGAEERKDKYPYYERMYGIDLSGREIMTGGYYANREKWKRAVKKAQAAGFRFKLHLGDHSYVQEDPGPQDPRLDTRFVDAHLRYVRQALEDFRDIETIGHGGVLAPFVQKKGQQFERNSFMEDVESLLGILKARNIGIEICTSDLIFGEGRENYKIYYWRDQGVDYYPAIDGMNHRSCTLSQWLARILIAAPNEKNPMTVDELMEKALSGEKFLVGGSLGSRVRISDKAMRETTDPAARQIADYLADRGRPAFPFVTRVAVTVSAGVFYFPGAPAQVLDLALANFAGAEKDRPVNSVELRAVEAFNQGDLDKAILDRLEVKAGEAPQARMPLVVSEKVLRMPKEKAEAAAQKIAEDVLRRSDLLIALCEGRKPPVIEKLLHLAQAGGFEVRSVEKQIAGAKLAPLLRSFSVRTGEEAGSRPLLVADAEEDLDFTVKGEKVVMDLEAFAQAGAEPLKALSLLRQIADNPENFGRIGFQFDPEKNAWVAGAGFLRVLVSLYEGQRQIEKAA